MSDSSMQSVNRIIYATCFTVCFSGCVEKIDTGVEGSAAASNQTSVTPFTAEHGVEMILLSGGEFEMGSPGGASDERPVHTVTLSPFVMDQYEVTQDLYAKLQLPNPAHFKGDRRPVEQVRWSDAALFCNERSRSEGLEPCYDEISFACNFDASGYRLPTEAEWEFAARSGNAPKSGDNKINLAQRACYAASGTNQTQDVGQLRPNAWGFYDMQGNVSEWCNDIYAENYYSESDALDPTGPTDGPKRVIRGGNWKSDADACRLTARVADDPGISDACFARDTFGFRCVRKPLPSDPSQ